MLLSDTVFQPIEVLVADSSQMQSQLLTSALRRRPDLKISACDMKADAILAWPQLARAGVILLNPAHHDEDCFATIRRVHTMYPKVPLILLGECYERDVVVSAFRSGVRGMFCFAETSLRSLCKCIHAVRDGEVWANTRQIHPAGTGLPGSVTPCD